VEVAHFLISDYAPTTITQLKRCRKNGFSTTADYV